MSDLIDRQDALDAIDASYGFASAINNIKALPSAQRTGKWIKLDMHAHLADHQCTACGQECYVPTCMGEPLYAYCPNCGAKMDKEDGDAT